MGVALGTAHGQPQPDRGGGVDAVHDRFVAELVGFDPTFLVDQRVAVEGGGDLAGESRLGQQVSRQLQSGEFIEGEIGVQRRDHPVAIGPHDAWTIDGVAMRVGIAGLIEPVSAPALAKQRIGHQAVHQLRVGGGGIVGEKLGDLFRAGSDPQQVEVQAADLCHPRGLGRRGKPPLPQFAADERIEWRGSPRFGVGLDRGDGTLGRKECPVALIRCPGGDPAAEKLPVGGGQLPPTCRWGHLLGGIGRFNPADQFAGVGILRHNRRAAPPVGDRVLAAVEPQLALPSRRVKAVTGKAGVRQQWANLRGVIGDRFRTGRGGK